MPMPTPDAVLPEPNARRSLLAISEAPSNFTEAVFADAGQLDSTIENLVGDAVAPTEPNAVELTVPKLTVCVDDVVSILHAESVMVPVKLIVPSAAIALAVNKKKLINETGKRIFFISFP